CRRLCVARDARHRGVDARSARAGAGAGRSRSREGHAAGRPRRRSGRGPAARAAVSPSARRAGTVLPGRLEDASGTPLGDVPYWADERPHRTHPGRAPEGAPRSDGAGGLDAQAEGLGEGAYLWFEIDDGLCIAVERATLGAAPVVRLPPRRDVAVEIRGLPAGEPWRIRAWPGWVD